jgi:hypothetical protein
MKSIIMLAAILAMAAGGADAKSCKDANGKFITCPTAAASSAKPGSCAKPPQCKKGKLCGCACISAKDTCHKS